MSNFKSTSMSSFLLKTACVFLFIECCFSVPITPYSNFMADLTRNNCKLPSHIPISMSANETSIEASLLVCNTADYFKFTKEASILCNEIFGLLKNISCSPFKTDFSKIQVYLSADVCNDFQSYKAVLPEGLLEHLSDNFNCKLMCSDNFEAPCKVLLWSFLVQSHIIDTETHPTLKTTKNTQVADIKMTPSLQADPQTKVSNVKSKDDDLKKVDLEAATNAAAQPGNLDAAQNPKESKTLSNILENKFTEPDVANFEDVPQEPSMKDPEVVTERVGTKLGDVPANGLTIPMNNNSLNVPTGKDKEETILNPVSVNNNEPGLVSNVPQGQTAPVNTEAKPVSKLPSAVLEEHNSEMFDDAKGNNPPTNTKNIENLETGNSGTDGPIGLITAPDNAVNRGITAKTDKKTVSEKKEETTAALPVKLPAKLPVQPTVDSTAVSESMPESIPSPTPVVSVAMTPSLENMEGDIPLSNDKDPDQYNLDNADGDLDGEYSKQEYPDGMYEPAKNKEPISETSKSVVPMEPIVSQIDKKPFNGLSRGSFGRGSEEIPEFAAFPDQEDSHFFFYFLSIVLILMAGYLIFHNKQKIIALIVEGRHERRRRSHGLGYKKLETK